MTQTYLIRQATTAPGTSRVASAARAASLCAGHVQQLGGANPLPNLMEVKG
jgi:hypothetical protein